MRIENDLGKDNIHKIVWRIAIPSMLAQFVSVLYSIVDRMYIGPYSRSWKFGLGRRRRMRTDSNQKSK